MFPKKNRFRAKPADGYPSMLERDVGQMLESRRERGEISAFRRQACVVLINCEHCGHRVQWKVDFAYYDEQLKEDVYLEAKGVELPEYRRKLKIWKKLKPHRLEIWKRSGRSGVYCSEVVEKCSGQKLE